MQLKILSWNIWEHGYFDQIAEFLKSSAADIIGLQEVTLNDPGRDTIGYLQKSGYEHVLSPFIQLKDGRTRGNAIFSKYKILASQAHELSKTPDRSAIQADIAVDNTELHIFNTHLVHTHQQLSEVQLSQTENLLKALPTSRAIVMGDFNATTDSVVIRKMSETLVDTDPTAAPTWCVYPAGCPTCNRSKIDTRLDYIFTTKDIKTDSFQVGNSKGSDHLPISITISYAYRIHSGQSPY